MKKNRKIKVIIISIILLGIISTILYNILTINNEYNIGEKNLKIPVFVYHNIVKNEEEVEYNYMQTTQETFRKQIAGLKKMGYHFISYEDLKEYNAGEKKLYKKSCIVTFDDGYKGVYQNALPVAKEYNIPITIFVITDRMEEEGIINWEEAKEMQDTGLVTIASHSTNHADFSGLTEEESKNNVNMSYSIIEEKLGKQDTKIFTYPYGLYTKEEIEILKQEGYIQNLTDNKINKSENLNLYELHRCYPLDDSIYKIIAKIIYRTIKYN